MLVKVVARADRKKNEEIELCLNGKREKQMIVFDVCRMVYEAYICDKKGGYKIKSLTVFPNLMIKFNVIEKQKKVKRDMF